MLDALWDLVWAGEVTNDTFAPLRALRWKRPAKDHRPRPGRLTALVGVRNLIVIEAGDALLICDAALDQKVKDIVDTLKRTKKIKKYL